jgi:hypothetical protein
MGTLRGSIEMETVFSSSTAGVHGANRVTVTRTFLLTWLPLAALIAALLLFVYYFMDAFVLEQRQVFVSPFDLNIEHGEIEQPLKPMIRLVTPVLDSADNKRGIVLVNLLGDKLISDISKAYQGVGNIMLLNARGFFLTR